MIKRKQFFVILLSLLSLVGWAQKQENDLYVDGEVIVKLKPSSGMTRRSMGTHHLNSVLRNIGITEADQLMPLMETQKSGNRASKLKTGTLYLLKFAKNQSVESTIEELKKLDYVIYAEPNYIIRAAGKTTKTPIVSTPILPEADLTQGNNDPRSSEQWYLETVNLPTLWQQSVVNSKRPIIAILDTGVDINHPDLAANIWTNAKEKGNDEDGNGFIGDIHGWDFCNGSPNISDTAGHGTHCAGIAAAVGNNGTGIIGANPDALIMPLKVLDETGSGSTANLIMAVDYAIANGSDIISMSFSRSCPGKSTHEGEMEALEEAARYAILVASAGNDGVCMNQEHQNLHGSGKFPDPYFPAAYPFVIGVQACNQDGSLADFSNFDCKRTPSVTVYGERKTPLSYETSAPGVRILSTLPSGEYGFMDGTSMACPLVAGALSRLIQVKAGLDNQKLVTMISQVAGDCFLDVMDLYNLQDSNLPQHAVNELFTKNIDGNEITFRVISATEAQVGDGSNPAVTAPSEKVVIPESVDGLKVTTIGSYAFSGVSTNSIVLPNSLIFIANYAFVSSAVTSVDIPESVKDIGENAFAFTRLHKVLIPKRVECISEGAFSSMAEVESFQVDKDNSMFKSQDNAIIETATGTLVSGINKIPYGVKRIKNKAFLYRDFKTIDIPNTVIEIGENAFEGCTNLESIDIPESVASIGFSAFNMCHSLKKVHLSKSVTEIGNGAFGGCENIESFTIDDDNPVYDSRNNCNAIIDKATNTLIHGFNCSTIPESIEGIAYNAFYYCDKLESIHISKTVKRIDYCPFIGCHNLRSVVIDKENPHYDSRDNCNAIIETATNKFLWGNQHSTIPSGVKILGIDAFWGAEFPEGYLLNIPEGVETIEHGSLNLMQSNGDISFSIPSSIKKIDEYASQFRFKSLYCYRKTPLSITDYVFREGVENATLYVPKGQLSAYRNARGWKNFGTIIEMDVEGADPPIEIEPITDEEVSFSDNVDEDTGLANTVIDNTYYNVDAENGDGYDATEQALVLNSTTSEEQMADIQVAAVGDEKIQESYHGIIFELAAGKGVITVDAKTIGSHVLNVQVGNSAPTKITKSERGTADVAFNITEPTYVYLYASTDASVNRAPSVADNSVLLYGYKVTLGASAIPGDANGDGVVNVTDIVEIVNSILGHPSAKFDPIAADVNGDGVVNVTDIVSVVNIILSDPVAARELLGNDEDE